MNTNSRQTPSPLGHPITVPSAPESELTQEEAGTVSDFVSSNLSAGK